MNKFTTNALGSSVVNSTAGTMIQEVKPEVNTRRQQATLPSFEKNKQGTAKIQPKILPPINFYTKTGPKFPEAALFTVSDNVVGEYTKSLAVYNVWLEARVYGAKNDVQHLLLFSGSVSATAFKPERTSTFEYHNPIHQSFTEYSVIKAFLL